jgi:hypothetical protein
METKLESAKLAKEFDPKCAVEKHSRYSEQIAK